MILVFPLSGINKEFFFPHHMLDQESEHLPRNWLKPLLFWPCAGLSQGACKPGTLEQTPHIEALPVVSV